MESNNNNDPAQIALDAALAVLNQVQNEFPYGPTNLKPIEKKSHPLSDKIQINYSLFPALDNQRRRKIDALVAENTHKHAIKSLKDLRMAMDKIQAAIENSNYSAAEKRYLIFKLIFFQMDKAAQLGMGNCGELSVYSFFQLMIKGYKGSVEYVSFKVVDDDHHEFIVLNRKKDSDISDWKTWGKDTIILDPWINRAFRANEFGSVWKENPWGLNANEVRTNFHFDQNVYAEHLKSEETNHFKRR